MGRLIVTEFVSLDGVTESPEKWSIPYWNDEISRFKNEEVQATDALLLGRTTYEGFAASWPSRSGDLMSDKFNAMPKYVASTTLQQLDWSNSKRLSADIAADVSRLKQQFPQDIAIHGSMTLMASLLPLGLIDEFRLLVYPVVLGAGKPLFRAEGNFKLHLLESRAMGPEVVLLRYGPAESA